MSNPSLPLLPTTTFLTLPPELRIQIYEIHFRTLTVNVQLLPEGHKSRKCPREIEYNHSLYLDSTSSRPSLLLSSRQIRSESLPLYKLYAFRKIILIPTNQRPTHSYHLILKALYYSFRGRHDWCHLSLANIREIVTPWCFDVNSFVANSPRFYFDGLRCVEITITDVICDYTDGSRPLAKRLFDVANAGDGIIVSSVGSLSLRQLMILRGEGNLFRKVRFRVKRIFGCEMARARKEDFVGRRQHTVFLECLVNPKTLEVLEYRSLNMMEDIYSDLPRVTLFEDYTSCDCDIDGLVREYMCGKDEVHV